ncbi:MAG TPA: aldehyde:ferredoxin oxidoreductase, partial [Deltaproteobacteria bacterium]|nr:aldehyde:ferredoxin oxidoreductase [Deltaproteobacteria bacterium]
FTLERYINCQRGFAKEDDFLPARFYREHGTPGPGLEIPPIERALFKETLERYYRVRGCSPDGVPTEKRLKELDII